MLHIFIPEYTAFEQGIVRYLRDRREKAIKIWFPKAIIRNDNTLKCAYDINAVEDKATINSSTLCFEWDFSNYSVQLLDYSFQCWQQISSIFESKDEFVILSSKTRIKDRVTLFVDSINNKDYPQKFIFPCLSSQKELDDILKKRDFLIYKFCPGVQFEVANNTFTHTRGAKVLREIKTGYYWYLDTFHRDHFEVFDNTGKKHIGEASITTGMIDKTKADKGKKAIL